MDKDNPAANIERMSLSELAALEADVIHQVTAGTIAPQEPNAISNEVEKRVIALKREIVLIDTKNAGLRSRAPNE
jgi:hypothetical protein